MKSLRLPIAIFLSTVFMFLVVNVFAHNTDQEPIDQEKVATKVEKISNGIQITITSDDQETVDRIQENASWYENHSSEGCRVWREGKDGHEWGGHHHMMHW